MSGSRPPVPSEISPDAELAIDVESYIEDHELHPYSLDWLGECEVGTFLEYCGTEFPEASFFDILAGDTAAARLDEILGGAKAVLFGSLDPDAVLVHPWAERLQQVSAFQVGVGLWRMTDLAKTLMHGKPPIDHFSEDERSLFFELDNEATRRTYRTGVMLRQLADQAPHYNDRAERLIRLWILFPTAPPIRRYLELLFRCYVNGQHAESVILCRSILERAVRRALGSRMDIPNEMVKRISLLLTQGKLSAGGAQLARTIWARGNKVIHEDPSMIIDAFATIEATVSVLQDLGAHGVEL